VEEPVRFKVRDDYLFGIVHRPESDKPTQGGVGILFRTAGLRYRIGPYRQYVRFARRFCESGYFVFRYDAPGIGDSEGSFRDLLEYRKRHAGDHDLTRQIIDFFVAETGISRLGVLGLCGGAYDALLTGASISSASFAILLSLVLEQADGSIPVGMGEFDSHAGWESFYEGTHEALERYSDQSKRVLFIYGGKDPFYGAFRERFGQKSFSEAPSLAEIRVIPDSDHVFSQVKWQKEAIKQSLKWLKRLE
jgi:dienelactone hydrolase